MSGNAVWRERAEILNEDLLPGKISERTHPPSLPLAAFAFLHLYLQTWGSVESCTLWCRTTRGVSSFVSRSPLLPLRHPGAPQTPSFVSEHVWFGPFYKCVTYFVFASSVSLSRIFLQLRSQLLLFFFNSLDFSCICFSLDTENTLLNSLFLSGIIVFIFNASPL